MPTRCPKSDIVDILVNYEDRKIAKRFLMISSRLLVGDSFRTVHCIAALITVEAVFLLHGLLSHFYFRL